MTSANGVSSATFMYCGMTNGKFKGQDKEAFDVESWTWTIHVYTCFFLRFNHNLALSLILTKCFCCLTSNCLIHTAVSMHEYSGNNCETWPISLKDFSFWTNVVSKMLFQDHPLSVFYVTNGFGKLISISSPVMSKWILKWLRHW